MFLGIDLGTSEVKVLLVDESGGLAGSAGSPLEVQRPHPRWSEQSPDAWWEATLAAIEGLDRKSTRLELQSRVDLVCRLLLEKKKRSEVSHKQEHRTGAARHKVCSW